MFQRSSRPLVRLVLALAAAAPVAAAAQSNVSISGRVDLSLDAVKAGSERQNKEVDNASRLGFRGVEDAGAGIKAYFGLEFGIGADTGLPTTPPYRHAYVGLGLQGAGVIGLGRIDSATPTGSPLYSLVTKNVGFAVHDAGAPAFSSKVLNVRNRFSNAISYASPDLAGFVVRARLALNGEDLAGVAHEGDLKNLDIGVGYNAGALGLGLGYGQNRRAGGALANDFLDKWIALAAYNFGSVSVYGVYGEDRYHAVVASRRGHVPYWLGGVRAQFGTGTLTANYMRRAVQSDVQGRLTKLSTSYAHALSKRTQVYGLFDREDPNSNVGGAEVRTLSLGVLHTF
jgi:predicted porin